MRDSDSSGCSSRTEQIRSVCRHPSRAAHSPFCKACKAVMQQQHWWLGTWHLALDPYPLKLFVREIKGLDSAPDAVCCCHNLRTSALQWLYAAVPAVQLHTCSADLATRMKACLCCCVLLVLLQELGGLVCDLPGVSVKDELAQYLQGLADEMKQLDYQVEDVVPKPQVRQQSRVKKTLTKQKKRKQQEQQQEEEEEPQEEQEVTRQQVERKKQRAKKQQAPEDAGKVTAAVATLPKKKQKQGPSAAAVQEEAEREERGATQIGAKAVEQVEQPPKRQRGVGRKQAVEADVGRVSEGEQQVASKPAEVKKKSEKRKAGKGK